MPANDLWVRQFIAIIEEGMKAYEKFLKCREVEDFDKSASIFEEWRKAYRIKSLEFEDFISIGKSLRARQAPNMRS